MTTGPAVRKTLAQAGEHLEAERARTSGPRWSIVGRVDRPQHPVGDVGRARDLQEVTCRHRVQRRGCRTACERALVAMTTAASLRPRWSGSCAARCAPTPTRATCSRPTRACTRVEPLRGRVPARRRRRRGGGRGSPRGSACRSSPRGARHEPRRAGRRRARARARHSRAT